MLLSVKEEFCKVSVASENFNIDLHDPLNFGVAFEILSSAIYKDKPLAIVRELASNAYDAHIRAGTEKTPFEIHLPDEIEPFWRIRDYGTGLAPDDLKRLIAGVFNSDKRAIAPELGGFGLGSKTPFSYVDIYDIVSYFQGVCYRFSAFRDEHGRPRIAMTSQYPTTEANGIEITVQVEPRDFAKFVNATHESMRFFFPKPVLSDASGVLPHKWETLSYEFDHPEWAFTSNTLSRSSPIVLIGPVAYPVSCDAMRLDPENPAHARARAFLQNQNSSVSCHFIIKAAPGDVKPAVSREELQYTAGTVQFIVDRINSMLDTIEPHYVRFFDEKMSRFELARAYGEVSRQWFFSSYKTVFDEALTFRVGDKEVNSKFFEVSHEALDRFDLRSAFFYGRKLRIEQVGAKAEVPFFIDCSSPIVFAHAESVATLKNAKSKGALNTRYCIIGTPEEAQAFLEAAEISHASLEDINHYKPVRARVSRFWSSSPLLSAGMLELDLEALQIHGLSKASWRETHLSEEDDASEPIYIVPISGFQFKRSSMRFKSMRFNPASFASLMELLFDEGVLRRGRIIGMRAKPYSQAKADIESGRNEGVFLLDQVLIDLPMTKVTKSLFKMREQVIRSQHGYSEEFLNKLKFSGWVWPTIERLIEKGHRSLEHYVKDIKCNVHELNLNLSRCVDASALIYGEDEFEKTKAAIKNMKIGSPGALENEFIALLKKRHKALLVALFPGDHIDLLAELSGKRL